MKFRLPRLYPILDTDSLTRHDIRPIVMAEALLEAGVRILQFRHKGTWTEEVFQQAKQIAMLSNNAGVTFVVNDRADYAALLNAAVHVGQHDLPPAAVRRVIRNGIIGFSTHNRAQLLRGDSEDVNYLAIGPIYQTSSKQNPDPALGLERLRHLRPLTAKPLVAIGGISIANARQVLDAGADSLALIGALLPDDCTPTNLRNTAAEWMRHLS